MKIRDNLTGHILRVISAHDGINYKEIARRVNRTENITSGILSMLKRQGKVTNRDALWYTTVIVKPKNKHVGEMKVGILKRLLEKYNDDFDVVVSIRREEDEDMCAFSLHDNIGEGWIPSGVVELTAKEMIMG